MKYRFRFLSALVILGIVCAIPFSQAQEGDGNEDLNVIELELENSKPKPKTKKLVKPTESQNIKTTEFSELTLLAPFSEVSVIQKRFLPKTNRFQFFGGITLTTNDPFYNTYGGTLRGGYFITEMFGVELQYFNLTSSEAQSTKELYSVQNIGTDGLSYTKEYLGASIQWIPIYGKMTWFNKKIVPFDFYFGVGGGQTKTHVKGGIGTFQLSTGQIFAISKSFAIRWDFSWNFFSAKAINEDGMINNLLFSAGASFFFPEAKYR
ncbi:MAG: outer membrane beta-barrel domain-containing protein [Bdellovibrionaceae bacterium]|nr:outer membrane beta-barrel domain-containing protein [Pseudobdellovibrionaceae bacterium]NUM57088.1 outer membrane beta-barrel domain-containing protein [Pseudobdellovibrionaceae bacterium]